MNFKDYLEKDPVTIALSEQVLINNTMAKAREAGVGIRIVRNFLGMIVKCEVDEDVPVETILEYQDMRI